MAKKAQKGKTAKNIAKPVKKAVVKKAAPKKVAKPVKKVASKKTTKPVKKTVTKKTVIPAKKAAPKKVLKPIKKILAKKVTAKKVIKPVKKAVAKKTTKNISKKLVKIITPVKVIKSTKPVKVKPAKVVVKKIEKSTQIVVKAKDKTPLVLVKKKVQNTPKLPGKAELKAIKKKQMQNENEEMDRPEVKIDLSASVIKKLEKHQPTPQVNNDTRMRYTDAELQEFKTLINEKLDEARKDFELLKSTLSHKDDHGTDDTSPTFKLLEDGSDVLSKEETAHLASRQEKFIMNLQNALIRIENKTYGICRSTGKLISKERLRSVPHATLSIDAKLERTS